jgi:hypothetical protein
VRKQLRLFAIATRFAFIEHLRNRFAMLLVAVFIPVWVMLVYLCILDTSARFRLRATDEILTAPGNRITQIVGGLNAVTLIVGFMMFAATFTTGGFDRRLAMAGYRRIHLVLAKNAALAVASAVVSLYATAVTYFSWQPKQPLYFAAALFCAALTYGALGVVFATVLRREVEGMFAIVMTSVIDLCLQNPVISSGSNSTLVEFLPSFGSMQAATAAAFTSTSLPGYLGIQLLWFAVLAVIGLFAFHRRTRNALPKGLR